MNWNEWFYYDETSPSCLRWAVSRASGKEYKTYKVKAGDVAGTLDTSKHWQVKLNKKLYLVHHIIWEIHNGKLEDSVVIDHEDRDSTNNKLSNYRIVTQKVNTRNRNSNKNNSSGVHGVNFTSSKGYSYWMAQWVNLDGKNCIKSFSVLKYGEQEALRMACEYRKQMIEELNAQGAGYTERHGT